MPSDGPSAQALAARLIAHARRRDSDRVGRVAAVAQGFETLSAELSRWLGPGGCLALSSRALKQTTRDHPCLAGVEFACGPHPQLQRLDASVATHGDAAVAKALEASLIAVFDLLARLIGIELASRLAEISMTDEGSGPTSTDEVASS